MKRNTPELITELKDNEVLVVGTNTQGRHGKGAAKLATKFGLKQGFPMGLQGQAYGIITKDLVSYHPESIEYHREMLSMIRSQIYTLYKFADLRSELTFLVTKIGTGLGGFSEEEIGEIFRYYGRYKPENIILPIEFE